MHLLEVFLFLKWIEESFLKKVITDRTILYFKTDTFDKAFFKYFEGGFVCHNSERVMLDCVVIRNRRISFLCYFINYQWENEKKFKHKSSQNAKIFFALCYSFDVQFAVRSSSLCLINRILIIILVNLQYPPFKLQQNERRGLLSLDWKIDILGTDPNAYSYHYWGGIPNVFGNSMHNTDSKIRVVVYWVSALSLLS